MTNAMKQDKTHRMVTTMAGTQPRQEIMTITPALATRWLALNTKSNRNLSNTTVEAYASEMRAGRWQLTHQAIAFNQAGELIDGQHRLQAVVLSDTTIQAYVATGLSLEYNAPIDVGYARRPGQILHKSSRWVSIVRGLTLLESGNLSRSFKSTVGGIEEVGARHAAAIDAVLSAPHTHVLMGVLSACAWAWPLSQNKVLSFQTQLSTGELLERGDPAFALRNWMQAGRRTTYETLVAGCNALRYLLRNEKLQRIATAHGDTRDSLSGYAYLCGRRRTAKLPGTPTAEQVPSR